ncbi:hypothetical protein [Streptomyces sp. NPDC093109]|uniref:hypothetical protein n=1 Tax=Streptomyces sp. NPDC093109 TaxID=3154977 RepID=UPI00344E84C6
MTVHTEETVATIASPLRRALSRARAERRALADRAEAAASLAEDLVGLVEAGLYPHADLVRDRLALTLAAAEAVAAGSPLLGEKWLPSLLGRAAHSTTGFTTGSTTGFCPVPALPSVDWTVLSSWSPWFATAQVRLTDALLTCWPTSAEPAAESGKELFGFGWLPQRYSDGWFLRRGDVRVPISDGRLLAWRERAARLARP